MGRNPFDWMGMLRRTPHGSRSVTFWSSMRGNIAIQTMAVVLGVHVRVGILPNKTINQSPEWWKVIVDFVENPKAWPNAAGTKGITSVAQLRAAQRKKLVSADVPTNFFLFFSSKAMH